MSFIAKLVGAGLVCACGAAMAGSALGSAPMLDRSTIAQLSADAGRAAVHRDPPARLALPDQYPLVTRKGTVPVERLAERGLYSQARYRMQDRAFAYGSAAFANGETAYGDNGERFAADAHGEEAFAPEPIPIATPASLAHHATPADALASHGAKMIDVEAALAMR